LIMFYFQKSVHSINEQYSLKSKRIEPQKKVENLEKRE